MTMKNSMQRLSWLAAVALIAAGTAAWADEPEGGKPAEKAIEGRFVPAQRAVPWERPVKVLFGGEQGEFRIGVLCRPADEVLRVQLTLDKEEGLVVDHVIPESAAAKAGLKQHDILLRAGDKPVADPQALAAAVQAAKEGELKLEILRAGERESIAVKPEKRTGKEHDRVFFFERPAADMLRHVGEAALNADYGPIQIRSFGPGMMVGGVAVPLPDNVSVSITKQGKDPAHITVKRGDESWTIKDTELDKLPEDLRGPIGGMLMHPGPMGISVATPGHTFSIPVPAPATRRLRVHASADADELDERLEQLDERVQELVDELRDLRRERRKERVKSEE